VTPIRALNDTELHELMSGSCAPFAIGDSTQVARQVRAAGKLYWASLLIRLTHLGEAIIGDSAVVLVEPRICVRVRPRPDDDSTPVIRESLLEWLNQEIERQSKHLKRSVVADAFPSGEGRVPNNPFIAAGLIALNKGGKRARALQDGFSEDESGRPTFAYEPTQAKTILVYPTLDDTSTGQIVSTETLWRYIEGLHAETPDVALAVLGQMCEPSVGDSPKFPMLTPVPITDEAILRYKGLGTDRESARLMIHAAMEDLRALSFDVCFNSPIPGRGLFWRGDRLFDIVKIEQYDEGLFGEEGQRSTTWLVRAGIWASVWFTPDTRRYIASMARVLLQLGNRKNRMVAKRIGQRLLLLSQARPPRRAHEVIVHELLGDIGELLLPDKREKNWASRIRENVEGALELLINVGLLKTVEWPDGFGPGNIDRSKGWSDRWLNARIRFTTVESGSARCHERHVDRTDGARLIGTTVRFARTNIVPGWTQAELARELKISRRHLSQIETGKRKPTPMLAEQLQHWLDKRNETERQSEFGFGYERCENGGFDALKSSGTERAALDSGTGPTFESRGIENSVHGRGATRQGTGAPTISSGTRTGTDKRNRPRDQE
jgi:DNA-binding XRE family transcriptional regulator